MTKAKQKGKQKETISYRAGFNFWFSDPNINHVKYTSFYISCYMVMTAFSRG